MLTYATPYLVTALITDLWIWAEYFWVSTKYLDAMLGHAAFILWNLAGFPLLTLGASAQKVRAVLPADPALKRS